MINTEIICLVILLITYLISRGIKKVLILISKRQSNKLNRKFKDLTKKYLYIENINRLHK